MRLMICVRLPDKKAVYLYLSGFASGRVRVFAFLLLKEKEKHGVRERISGIIARAEAEKEELIYPRRFLDCAAGRDENMRHSC